MNPEFWHSKWEKNEIAFHQKDVNQLLASNIERLFLEKGDRIFVPLCGKTLDIPWLVSKGYKVAGCELVESAVQQLFEELNITPTISNTGAIKIYSPENIDILIGNIFDLDKSVLGSVNAIYDRAALVALPHDIREKYTQHLVSITGNAKQLLIVFEYDQRELEGPPFSISSEEIEEHYSKYYTLSSPQRIEVKGGLKGKCYAIENVWILTKK